MREKKDGDEAPLVKRDIFQMKDIPFFDLKEKTEVVRRQAQKLFIILFMR